MSLVDPRIVRTFVEWTDFMYPVIEQYGVPAVATDDKHWQEWASGLLSFGNIADKGAPNPYQFSDWREWAFRFNESLGQGY